ncbi:tRNA preQ1(34) S-adenosylmethionine ribosyltransferase-isomerase QueA [Rubrobacter tropicus]|uniref:S-adenosylmethionine:tRNA ribosyltransferase-isomerase n=1 Tax=Rubrobacter tropicus TaxID=2653851 RepID=A0A6G8Q8S9_9ACTN|nr:tRNA preQ1(34) S-adenosylmethionine ribosyltransferase-isomerase QueA [Rubrobacter tropicus]QIN82895.1 tRNA preQ1(34) S-adenosylmethionine ribosyltransferase-isomerase QueA [Rubrobacter tropicus]
MLTSELDYALPEALIAQSPAEPRDASRLMVLDAARGTIDHRVFRDLPGFLRPGDALVLNETKVLPARLEARKPTGGAVELLFLRDLGPERGNAWEVLARPSKRLRPGLDLIADGTDLRLVEDLGDGYWAVSSGDVLGLLERSGRMPLPPYIEATPEAEGRYQTVYAREAGSAAAPTAGFHFTEDVLERSGAAGAEIPRVTLHVGTGTFLPVRTDNLEDHQMHAEHYRVPAGAARKIEDAGRVVAAGTTVARTLETWAATGEREGESRLFVYPGYRWRAVDALLTNFHLPRSTLLAMVMSFGGTDLVREAYRVAVEERYRFYSFGDAMLILNGGRNL